MSELTKQLEQAKKHISKIMYDNDDHKIGVIAVKAANSIYAAFAEAERLEQENSKYKLLLEWLASDQNNTAITHHPQYVNWLTQKDQLDFNDWLIRQALQESKDD